MLNYLKLDIVYEVLIRFCPDIRDARLILELEQMSVSLGLLSVLRRAWHEILVCVCTVEAEPCTDPLNNSAFSLTAPVLGDRQSIWKHHADRPKWLVAAARQGILPYLLLTLQNERLHIFQASWVRTRQCILFFLEVSAHGTNN